MEREDDERFLREAIRLAEESVRSGGGPFGALVVREGEILARGMNRVTSRNDPTAHAEIEALREACRRSGDFRLPGCHVYASSEPCPMCAAALCWARVERIVYGAGREVAAAHGFDDRWIAEELARPPEARRVPVLKRELAETALRPFRLWEAAEDRVEY